MQPGLAVLLAVAVGLGTRADNYLANVMPVMQRLVTAIAALPDGTCTPIWSMIRTSAAVRAVPSAGVS